MGGAAAGATASSSASQPGGTPSDNLFVAGLPLDMDDARLKSIFAPFGEVVDCRVLPDSGKADRAALCRMQDVETATFMVSTVSGTIPNGSGLTNPVTIRYAESKKPAGNRSAPYENAPAAA